MKTEDLFGKLQNRFPFGIVEMKSLKAKRALIKIRKDILVEMAKYLYSDLQFRFIIASGLDTKEGLEILYHFSFDATGLILNVDVVLPQEKPEIESLTGLFDAANWIEREIHEILGVNFLHHPNLKKLISEGNWEEGVYPYRKNDHKPAKETS